MTRRKPLTWTRTDVRWYVCTGHGNIVHESSRTALLFDGGTMAGWYWYPPDTSARAEGPFETLAAAKQAAGRWR